ncbi:MAG: DUF4197 domain-containing protein [Cyclobacteriaceae bacterium]|nr:DUF4197 domain-containing protein [Cyclobacteriaceae bacterium]
MSTFKTLKFLAFLLVIQACTSAQINQTLGGLNDAIGTGDPTTDEVIAGLKEALIQGISKGSDNASKIDGYLKNPQIKIPFPPDAAKVEDRLRDLGLGKEVDKFITSINRGAERAALEAKPIFINAIKSMTIEDAWGILKGEPDAATQYLKRTTSAALKVKFQPIIKSSLDEVNATKYYGDLVNTYNKIPLVKRVDPELDNYATDKAIEGLFTLIAQEEANIRKNPLARTTELLKKVFGYEG